MLILFVVGACSGLGAMLRDAGHDRVAEGTAVTPGLLRLLPASLAESKTRGRGRPPSAGRVSRTFIPARFPSSASTGTFGLWHA